MINHGYTTEYKTDEWDETDVFVINPEGEKVFEWDDWAHVNYPEDLTWNRMISDVYWSGFEEGYKAAMKEKNNVEGTN